MDYGADTETWDFLLRFMFDLSVPLEVMMLKGDGLE